MDRRQLCAAGASTLTGCASPSTHPSGDAVAELGGTGRSRVAINFGNPILASRGPGGEPRGVSVDLAFVAIDPVRAADTGYTAAYVIIDNKAPNSGSCESPDMSVSALPSSNAVNIALAKRSRIVAGSEMPPFFTAKLNANGGDPADSSWRVLAAA